MSPGDVHQLKEILKHTKQPETLDEHPWAFSMFARAVADTKPALRNARPGVRLIAAIGEIFADSLPAIPPRKSKRLDSRWGEFGILAALYFAPTRFGCPTPASLRDAWGRIDNAILLFVFGRAADLTQEEFEQYKLVGDEPEAAPSSTLSDWHRKGIQRLAAEIRARETYVANRASLQEATPSKRAEEGGQAPPPKRRTPPRKTVLKRIFLIALLFFLIGTAIAGFSKGKRIYALVLALKQDVATLQALAVSPNLETLNQSGPHLADLRSNFELLKEESAAILWLAPVSKWVPVYGGDLSAAPDLIELVDALLASVEQSYSAALPLLDSPAISEDRWNIARSLSLLHRASPQFALAQTELERAQQVRNRLDPARLSPPLRSLLLGDVDRALSLMEDGLTLALEAPGLAGFSNEGPKTYLLLAQNEDELRPTGGFITAAGTLLVKDGQILSLSFQNSPEFDNWEWPYPPAPWPLEQYMNSPVLIFRDANWYTDFPTSVQYIEYIYSYTNSHSVDGVIAFDQHFLVEILRVTGPIELEGEEGLIDAGNVIDFMRAEKTPSGEELESGEWHNKAFINKITVALLDKFTSNGIPPHQLSKTLVRALDERHLLLQLDKPQMAELLARRSWDGALRAGQGDFLMVVDSNVGFNKTNAVVESSFSYDVDLTNPEFPEASLVVTHRNHASGQIPCLPYPYLASYGISDELQQKTYPIDRCYWNYLRVYTLADTELLNARLQDIPPEWTVRRQSVPQRVDDVDEELDGVRGWGVFEVVPGGESVTISLHYALPTSILIPYSQPGQYAYLLKIQKQPGIKATPVTLRVHLPSSASLVSAPPGSQVQGPNILLQLSLVRDAQLEFIFVLP
jgi:hypothetical protein